MFVLLSCSHLLLSQELERTEEMYRGLVGHARRVLMGYFDLVRVCKGEAAHCRTGAGSAISDLQLKLSVYNSF